MKRKKLRVRDVMTALVHTCQVDDTLERVAQLLWEHDCGCLPVVDAEGVVRSMITDRDICMAAYTGGRSLGYLRVADSTSRGLVVCGPDDELASAAKRMAEHQVRRLPVVDEAGRLQGLLSVNDMACHAADGCTAAIDDPAAANSLEVLMAVCHHRSARVQETALETAEIRPPKRDVRAPLQEAGKA